MSKRKKKNWVDDWSEQDDQVNAILGIGKYSKGKTTLLDIVKSLTEAVRGKDRK